MSSPPELAVLLVADHLDPKTTAVASCVCKSWNKIMSSDQVWEPICLSHYPSLFNLLSCRLPHHALFSLLRNSTLRCTPSPPRISLHHLVFTVDVFLNDRPILSTSVSGGDLSRDESGVFRFNIGVEDESDAVLTTKSTVMEEMRVVWTVVMEGTKALFLIMECGGGMKGNVVVTGNEVWFSEELKRSCCFDCIASHVGKNSGGIVAEMGVFLGKLGFCDDDDDGGIRGTRVKCLKLGLLSSVSWRYLNMDDALRYLEEKSNFVQPVEPRT